MSSGAIFQSQIKTTDGLHYRLSGIGHPLSEIGQVLILLSLFRLIQEVESDFLLIVEEILTYRELLKNAK